MTKLIEQVLTKFISTQKPEVLAISGAWGVGKTYALHKIINSSDVTSGLRRYAYVSLFGVRSITELRTKVWTRGQNFPLEDAEESTFQKLGISSWGGKLASYVKDAHPLGKNVVVGIETVVANLIKDTIICFDDLERLGNGIAIDDFMGLVSELKEQCRCKVIIVFNEEQLHQHADLFKKYSEKVIDQKLLFLIDPLGAASIGLPENTPLRKITSEYLVSLQVCNIRVVQKIATALEYIYPIIENHSDAVKAQVACAIAIFSASLYEGGRGFPSSERILKYNYFQEIMAERIRPDGGIPLEPALIDWQAMLEACHFSSADELDLEILKALKQGYPDGTDIRRYADELDAKKEILALEEIFSLSWRKFHDRFDVNAEQLSAAFIEAVATSGKVIAPGNLNGTVKLLRQLNLNDDADRLIDIYIGENSNNAEKFNPSNWVDFGDGIDETFQKRMAAARKETSKKMSLQDAAQVVIDNEKWDEAAGEAFLAANPQEFVDLFKANQGSDMRALIKGLQNLPYEPIRQQTVRSTVTEALAIIADESLLNEIRVRRFGVDMTERRANVEAVQGRKGS